MSETSTIKHEIHMAKHEGYDITHPTEFFQKYGPRVLKVLQWLRYGVAVAGVVAPGLGHLGLAGGIDQLQKALGSTIKDLKPLMDKAIQFLEGQMNSSGSDLELTPDQAEIEKLEVLEGADLRQLESFLKVTDQARSLANLYRIVTHEGHVKWVCIDHYRANYQESAVKQLQEFIEAHNGEFSEEEGKIKVRVGSRSAAKQFYGALVKAPRIQELDIQLGWDATLDDFRKFKDAVSNANIVHLVIDDFPFDGPVLDAINSSRRFSPLVELMSNMRIQSVEFRYLKNMEARISSSSFATSSRLRILIISSLISVALFSRIIQNCTSLVELKIQVSPLRDAIQEVTRRASSLSNIKSVCISNKSALVEFSLHQGCITNIRLSDRDKQFLDFIDTLPVDQFDSLELNSIIVQDLKCLVEILRASTRLSNLSLSCTAATALSTIELVKEIRVAGQSTGVLYEPLILRFHNPDAWDQSDGFMVTVKPSGTSGIADGIFVSIQMFSSSRYASRNPWFWEKIFQQYGSQIHEIHRDFKLSDEYASLFDEATNRDGCNLMSLHMDMSELSISGMERMSRVIARCRPESFHRLDFTFDDLQSERQDIAMRLLSKHGTLIHKLTIRSSSLKRLIPELQKLHLTKHDLPALEDFFLFDNLRDSSMIFSKSSVEWLCSMISVPVLSPVLTVLDPEASTTVPLIRYDIKPLRSFSLSNIRMQTRAWDILLSSLDFSTLETLRLLLCDLEIAVLERMVDCIPENDDIEVPLRELEISYSHFEPSSKFKEVAEKLKRKAPLVHIVYQHQKIY
ncbi:hypothetical protein BGZ99_000496 [Dissophora globulifera]|uniref:Uncharacterized protein n=1 Tax=Dissophora globulifera TaxID=979702 RepID=A0A9P6V0P9_9FUNG|nr:hypothetical protein BGZ99_000496 [Dissophora globulifera]